MTVPVCPKCGYSESRELAHRFLIAKESMASIATDVGMTRIAVYQRLRRYAEQCLGAAAGMSIEDLRFLAENALDAAGELPTPEFVRSPGSGGRPRSARVGTAVGEWPVTKEDGDAG